MNWRPIETAPIETEVRLLLDDGREALGEYWTPPPIEIDPEQIGGGWAICLIGSGLGLDLGLSAAMGNLGYKVLLVALVGALFIACLGRAFHLVERGSGDAALPYIVGGIAGMFGTVLLGLPFIFGLFG